MVGWATRPDHEVATKMTPGELPKKLRAHFLANEFRQLTLATKEQLEELKPQNDEDCHRLAERWVNRHAEHRVVRGFLVVNECVFNKHSVVDTGSLLLDVKPRDENESRSLLDFIVCDGVSRPIFEGWDNQATCPLEITPREM